MRRFVLTVSSTLVALASLTSMSSAADIPRKAPAYAPIVPVFTWTGFYVGGHVGYGWSDWTGIDPVTGTTGTEHGKGWLGGLQLGYNYQFNNFVVGIEGDYSWADVKRQIDNPLGFGGNITLKNDYFATLTARLGYAFDRFLVYGKGGAAWTRDKWDVNDGLGGTATGTFNRTGWTLGVGVEYALMRNFSVKGEYNYLEFKSINETLTTGGGLVAAPVDVSLKSHLLKLGVNYRF